MGNNNRVKLKEEARKRIVKKRTGKGRTNSFNGKIFFLLTFLALLFTVTVGRLFYLQVIAADDLTRRALKEMTKVEDINSDRGLILDRNRKKLAVNVSASNVYFQMSILKKKSEEEKHLLINEVADKVSAVGEVDRELILEKLKGEKRVKLLDSINRDKSLNLRGYNIPGLLVEDQIKRFYPFNNLAAHIIGFINSDGIGQYGLEASFNKELTGIAGKSTSLKDLRNKKLPISDESVFAPKEGLTIVSTIDEYIQKTVEAEAEEALAKSKGKGVSIIVQDPNTGEILAMTNKPDYNINLPKSPQSTEEKETWSKLSEKEVQDKWFKNWRNFAVNDLYEPGSTFKSITTAAALEEDRTEAEKHYYCTGYIRDIPGLLTRCTSLPNPHGDITLNKAFAESCNPTFVNIARELGKEKLYKYIEGFGFGEKTGIALPSEEKGLIPPDAKMSNVSLATISYGHGIATTPLQMINATSALVNGGNLMVPLIVKELINNENRTVKVFEPEIRRQVISKETSDAMLMLMEGVVEKGTGSKAKISGYKIGGKTGTSFQIADSGVGYNEDKYYSSFIGVAPIKNPKIVVLVIVDDPKGDFLGGTVAAPTAGNIIEKVLNYLTVERTEQNVETKVKRKVEVPDVTNMLIEDAGKILSDLGLKFSAESDSTKDFTLVTGQSPEAGTEVEEGSIVDLFLDPNQTNSKTMPILSGKTKQEVETILNELRVDYKIEGDGIVIEQEPKPGKLIKLDEPLVIKLAKPLNEDETNSKGKATNNKSESGQ